MITGPLWLMVLWVLALPAMGAFGAFLQWCASDRRGCPCVECRAIQVVDPLRHFTGCSKREPLPEGHPQAAPKPEDALPDQSMLYVWYLYARSWAIGAYDHHEGRPSPTYLMTGCDRDNAYMIAQAIGLDQGHLRKYGADKGDPDTALLTADDLEARVRELLGFDAEDDDESCTDGIDLLACPMCGGDIIEIRPTQRGGNTFWGCSNYTAEQKCDFKLWQKPIQKIGRQRTDLKRNAVERNQTRTDGTDLVAIGWADSVVGKLQGDRLPVMWLGSTKLRAAEDEIVAAETWLTREEIAAKYPIFVAAGVVSMKPTEADVDEHGDVRARVVGILEREIEPYVLPDASAEDATVAGVLRKVLGLVQRIGRQRTDLKRNARPAWDEVEPVDDEVLGVEPGQLRTDAEFAGSTGDVPEVVRVGRSDAEQHGERLPVWVLHGVGCGAAPTWLMPDEIAVCWPTVVPPIVEDAIVENCVAHLKTCADHAESASLREYGHMLAETVLDVMTSRWFVHVTPPWIRPQQAPDIAALVKSANEDLVVIGVDVRVPDRPTLKDVSAVIDAVHLAHKCVPDALNMLYGAV